MKRLLTTTQGRFPTRGRPSWKIEALLRIKRLNIFKWDDLDFFRHRDWAILQSWLDEYDQDKIGYAPARENLFAALDAVPYDKVKVMWMGQDPYPGLGLATGVAFSIRKTIKPEGYPGTLKNIFKEYQDDLHYPEPPNGDLTPWCKEGVLLWNAYPSCFIGKPGSHRFPEWAFLTTEIVERLRGEKVVFVLSGAVAREFAVLVEPGQCIETSHPSPRGSAFSKKPFVGSRVFSTVNAKLATLGKGPINWRLS